MEESGKTKRDIVVETIEAGGATIDSLIDAADCKYASVMSIFSMLRLMGKCPVKDVPVQDDDGNEILTYRFVSTDEWEAIKADRAENAKVTRQPKKSPEQILESAKSKVERATKALELATTRVENDPDNELLDLRKDKAVLELRIAELELEELDFEIEDGEDEEDEDEDEDVEETEDE